MLQDTFSLWADINVGGWVVEWTIKLDKSDGPACSHGKYLFNSWQGRKVENIEAIRIRKRAWKSTGCHVWIDSSNVIYEFYVGDTMHAQSKCFDASLEDIEQKMSQQEYSPSLHWVS